MPKGLQFVLLGVPRFLLHGVPLALRYSKTRALLAYLAVSGERERRERLAGLLWSDKDEGDARTNLRTVLSSVRKVLGDYLEIDRQSVGLRPGSYYLDVTDFINEAHSSSEAQLREAAALYRGDLLEGFTVAGAPLFDEWLSAERARLRDLALGALHTLARQAAERGAYDQAALHLGRLLELDPWREDSTRHLMRVLAASGQTEAALTRYAQLRDMLAREFGLPPSPETVSLYEALSSPAPNAQDAASPHNVPAFLTSFVTRPQTREVQRLLADPACRLLTLTGAGGSGKTRLAAEVSAHLAPNFAQGVWYVPLASLTAPEDLMPTVADVLGIATDNTSSNTHESVLTYLRNRQLLLVLDNFEHLLAAKTFVQQLLETAAGVNVLVTSRVRLGLKGEWTFPVDGLAYPPLTKQLTLPDDALETFGALALFKQSALRVLPALATFYTSQDRFREAEAVFSGAAERFPTASPTRARLMVRTAFTESELGHHERARRHIEDALSVMKQRGAPTDVALAFYTLGFILYGDYEGAKSAFSESLCLYQELNDPHGVADALNYLGNVEVLLGNYTRAKTSIKEALALRQTNGESRWAIAKTLSELGEAAFQAGELDEAEAYHQEVLTLCQGMRAANRQISALTRIGEVSFERGQVEEAERYYRQALGLALERYAPRRIALALLGICDVLACQGWVDEALEPLYAIAHAPSSPAFYRAAAEEKISSLIKNTSAYRASAIKARAATKDLLELAESVLGEPEIMPLAKPRLT